MNGAPSTLAKLESTDFTMLSSCCASVVYLDKGDEQKLHEAFKPVSSHSLPLDRTQKVPTGNIGSQPFSISIDVAVLFSTNDVTLLNLIFVFRHLTVGLEAPWASWLPAETWLEPCSCYVFLLPLSVCCPTSYHGQMERACGLVSRLEL